MPVWGVSNAARQSAFYLELEGDIDARITRGYALDVGLRGKLDSQEPLDPLAQTIAAEAIRLAKLAAAGEGTQSPAEA